MTKPPSVHILPGAGKRDPDGVLESAKAAELESVVIVGYKENGGFYIGTSEDDNAFIAWILAQGHKVILG